MALRDDVFAMLTALYEGTGVTEDSDGDFEVDLGEQTCWVRVVDDPPMLSVFAPVANEIPSGPHIAEKLGEINGALVIFRALWEQEHIVLRADLIAAPLVALQLQRVLDDFSAVAAELAEETQAWSRF